jgi:hypothetical protein
LNSDRIKQIFGSYTVDILLQEAQLRVANLCSQHGQQMICRTLAVTLFSETLPTALKTADQQIRAGASIGETFRDLGFVTHKRNTHWCVAEAGEQFARLTGGEVNPGSPIAVRLYSLVVEIVGYDAAENEYATIAEAYHPNHESIRLESPSCDDDLAMPDKHREALQRLKAAL